MIGANVFIGSGKMLVAPVTVSDAALTGSESVITADKPASTVALGRSQQIVKPGHAVKWLERLRAKKAHLTSSKD